MKILYISAIKKDSIREQQTLKLHFDSFTNDNDDNNNNNSRQVFVITRSSRKISFSFFISFLIELEIRNPTRSFKQKWV